jgi:hypothetical protein
MAGLCFEGREISGVSRRSWGIVARCIPPPPACHIYILAAKLVVVEELWEVGFGV